MPRKSIILILGSRKQIIGGQPTTKTSCCSGILWDITQKSNWAHPMHGLMLEDAETDTHHVPISSSLPPTQLASSRRPPGPQHINHQAPRWSVLRRPLSSQDSELFEIRTLNTVTFLLLGHRLVPSPRRTWYWMNEFDLPNTNHTSKYDLPELYPAHQTLMHTVCAVCSVGKHAQNSLHSQTTQPRNRIDTCR